MPVIGLNSGFSIPIGYLVITTGTIAQGKSEDVDAVLGFEPD